jgi:L-ribulose-5-phosphate 3-epimerase
MTAPKQLPKSVATRRGFLSQTAGAAIGVAAATGLGSLPRGFAQPAAAPAERSGRRIYKSVKWGMIGEGASVAEKFALCRDLGYDGMELVSPADFKAEEVRAASEATGMPVHGVVDMRHWDVRLSSPDQATREQGVEILAQAIRDAHAFGGFSVLLVSGRVNGDEETHDHVWQRSIPCIREVLPLASRLGVRVLIENVWNGFCETAEQARDYLDEIDSPWVGQYFDIGNVRKFATSESWIRTLGARIVKLDVKDWGASNGFCKIGDGDVDWPAVRTALDEIKFTGWCTAEVDGGPRDVLADVAARMDRVLVAPEG